MEQIIEIFNNCVKKLKKINNHRYGNIDGDDETYYSIYLTSLGIRNGTYLETGQCRKIDEEDNIVKDYNNAFEDLRKIKNIDFYVGKLYDCSKYRDTIYIYYKPRKVKLFKIIKKIEAIDRYNYNNELMYKIHNHIAKLLSYEVVNYRHSDRFILIQFRLTKNDSEIMGYYTTKDKLSKAFEKLQEINKGLKLIKEYCKLVILDESD
jgi:hypothetical protein